jgi:16S rRNA (cytosine967-C5)-methyltransferase
VRSVRSLALGILIRVERDRAHAAPLLDARGSTLPQRDRDLLRVLVKGVLRNAIRLDHVVSRHLDRPIEELDVPVRAALRLGAAQLLLLDRVPSHAAVSETVEAAKEIAPRGAGLVNAVLRKVAANEERPGVVRLPDASPLDRLAVETSHPRWLVRRWAERFGRDAVAAVLAADNADSAVDLLADPLVGSREEVRALLERDGVLAKPSDWAPLALTALEGDAIGHPLVRSGQLAVVDAAAQALVEIVPAAAVVADLTAAPGGKTRALLARGKARRVVALERQPSRALRLARNLSGGGRRGEVLVVLADAAHPPLAPGSFESVLLDAPCSGTGTLRKNPEIRSRLRREDFASLATLQRELLSSAIDLLVTGGTVTWITCSLEPEENEDVVDAVLAERGDAIRLRAEEMPVPASLVPWTRPDGLVRILPGPENDGFSALIVRRIRQWVR